MSWPEVTIYAGLLIGLVGCVSIAYQVYRRWSPRAQGRRWGVSRLEAIGELASQAACLGGIATLQFGNVAQHVTEGTAPAHLWLSIVSVAAAFTMFGIALGRLHMRWQLWSLRAVLDTKSGEFVTSS